MNAFGNGKHLEMEFGNGTHLEMEFGNGTHLEMEFGNGTHLEMKFGNGTNLDTNKFWTWNKFGKIPLLHVTTVGRTKETCSSAHIKV